MGTVCQQSLNNVDIHFMAVPANRIIAVDVPVTVYEVIHIAAVPFAVRYYILEIEFSRLGE